MVTGVKAREVNKYIGKVWDEFSRLTDEQAIRKINAYHNAYKRYMADSVQMTIKERKSAE